MPRRLFKRYMPDPTSIREHKSLQFLGTLPGVFLCPSMTGAWRMNVPARSLPDDLTWEWISGQLSTLWQPFLLGSLVLGVVLGALAYCLTMGYWRWWVAHQWNKRKLRRA